MYYGIEKKKIRDSIAARKEKLYDTTLNALLKYGLDVSVARQTLMSSILSTKDKFGHETRNYVKDNPQASKIMRKLKSYQVDFNDLVSREQKSFRDLSDQRKRLMNVISKTVIGRGYWNIMSHMPVEGQYQRVMAVLKEVRFDKNLKKRFLPGKVQFVFALFAVHKELVLNLVNKGSQNNYDRLLGILSSSPWTFNHSTWNHEISLYNNRILDRQIITGNILGAYANPLIQKMKPHFITFSLSPDDNSQTKIERGLLLPMSGENVENLISNVTLPLGYGLKYATAINHVYRISGIGLDFSILPVTDYTDKNRVKFCIGVVDKDSRKFESDSRFDAIRDIFKGKQVTSIHNKDNNASKRPLMRHETDSLSHDSPEFASVMTLLASLRAVILIPRSYLTVGEMRDFANLRMVEDNSDWPVLDWRNSNSLEPPKREVQIKISSPEVNSDVVYVDDYPPYILLGKRTLSCHGHSLKENTMPGQLRSLYLEWNDISKSPVQTLPDFGVDFPQKVIGDIHRILVNSSKESTVQFSKPVYDKMKEITERYQLSTIGKTIAKYREEMLFSSPPKPVAEKFLDQCLYDPRLATIRTSLENYINGKTDIILDL